jgi:ABC-type phosphate transport system permease subunit
MNDLQLAAQRRLDRRGRLAGALNEALQVEALAQDGAVRVYGGTFFLFDTGILGGFTTGEVARLRESDFSRILAYVLFIVGTLLVTLGALLIAVPLGIAAAIFISELAPSRLKTWLKSAVELLAGIPSVVFGFFGLIVLTDWIRVTFDKPTGESWLAGSIILGIMAIPTIVSVSEDAISSVPREYK